jgi:hypothetical protein
LRKNLLTGNFSDPGTEEVDSTSVDTAQVDPMENSKSVYFNDSFELDEIPLDTISIIDLNDNDDS